MGVIRFLNLCRSSPSTTRSTLSILIILIIIFNNQQCSSCFLTNSFWTGNSDNLITRSNSQQQQIQQNQHGHHNPYHTYKSRDMQLEDFLSQGEEKCINKPCVQSEQCCPGSVCVDLHSSTGKRQVTGTCLPIYGVNEGDSCLDDNDCESGLRCMPNQMASIVGSSSPSSSSLSSSSSSSSSMLAANNQPLRTCQPPGQEMMKKQYNAECTTSSECDASQGLCCQLIKRHRMAPRKSCLYFSDPKICLGPVDVTFAKPAGTYYFQPGEHEYFSARIG